ncbi:MAG: hypothetical protein HY720_04430 [Planctomycetes bacterium]|nr:hypothetical protein [Planctomycetota bacterium]
MNLNRRSNKASALIISLGVLLVLAAVAIGMARLMGVEKSAARTHTESVQARLAAEAGVASAVARLERLVADQRLVSVHDAFSYRDSRTTPLDLATAPSYREGVAYGYAHSGLLPTTGEQKARYRDDGLHFALRIYEGGSLIALSPLDPSGNGNTLALDNLGRMFREGSLFSVFDGTIGTKLAAAQPTPAGRPWSEVGCRTWEDVRRVLWTAYGVTSANESAARADLWLLSQYATLDAAFDAATVEWWGGALARHDPKAAHETTPAPRAPVNVNTAPAELLTAVFSGIEGASGKVDDDSARGLARAIVEERDRRGPATAFTSFEDLERFIAGLTRGPGAPVDPKIAGLVLASSNPNARLVGLNPDVRIRYLVDANGTVLKTDRVTTYRVLEDKTTLVRHTTELSVAPSGRFLVTSLGRVLDRDGRVLASHEVQATIELMRSVRLTSQAELLGAARSIQGLASYPEPVPTQAADTRTGGLRLADTTRRGPQVHLGGFAEGRIAAYLPDGEKPNPAPPGLDPAKEGSVFDGGDRLDDGLLSQNDKPHVVAFGPANRLNIAEGAAEFWVKFDDDAFDQDGDLFFANNDLSRWAKSGDTKPGIHTAIWYTRDGMLHFARTYYMLPQGTPGAITKEVVKRRVVKGELHEDAYDRLFEYAYDYIRKVAPKSGPYWVPYANWFAKKALRGVERGETQDLNIFHDELIELVRVPYDACRPPPPPPPDTSHQIQDPIYRLVYKEGYEVVTHEFPYEDHPRVVNESAKHQFRSDTNYSYTGDIQKFLESYQKVFSKGLESPYAANQIELLRDVKSIWRPGEWHHIRIEWTGWDPDGGSNDIRVYIDRSTTNLIRREWGPLTVFSNRITNLDESVYFGPNTLLRFGGQPQPMALDATFDRLLLSRKDQPGDFADRYRGTPSGTDSRAEFGFDLSGLGAPAGKGGWVDWTSYLPRDLSGKPIVDMDVEIGAGGAWKNAARDDGGIQEGFSSLDLSKEARVRVTFRDRPDSLRDNPGRLLDETAFLDDVTVRAHVNPTYLRWESIQPNR